MDDFSVIDTFLDTFIRFIDSGFGLLRPDVAFLTSILIAIDITLAGLFWALRGEDNVIGALIRKVLYVGFFAFIINNFQALTQIVFDSFSRAGLNATRAGLTPDDLLSPGFVAHTGFTAAYPILNELGQLVGPVATFVNLPTLLILGIAYALIVISFFILAVQVFITIIEFKLTTLAGFILIPFALWNRSAFLAERVLGNVISSGVKVMVLAVIIGIGSTIFGPLAAALTAGDVEIENALTVLLASLAMVGLGVFGPGVAAGLVSGAPQLGAGAAFGTGAGLIAGGAAGIGLGAAGGRLLSGIGRGGTAAAAAAAGGASMAYGLGRATSGASGLAGVGAGLAGVAAAGAGAMKGAMGKAMGSLSSGAQTSAQSGARAAFSATGGSLPASAAAAATNTASGAAAPPAWAKQMRQSQRVREATAVAGATLRDGDRPGGADSPDLKQRDD